MKNKVLGILFASALLLTAGGAVAKSFVNQKENKVEPVLAGEGTYYSGISDSLTGDDLLTALHTLNSQKKKKNVGYDGMKTFASKCDADPDGSGKIIGFYDNSKLGPSWDSAKTWNREHVWPNVRDGDLVEDDAHMTRPASVSANSDRGSKGFGTKSYDPGKTVAFYRGVASRIIFYAAIADTSLKVVDFPFNYNGVGNGNSGYPVGSMGSLSDMLRWNLEYLPSDTSFTGANDLARRTELNRNEVIQNNSAGQGNRNPFIDHPEYACKIWGNTNETTKDICGLSEPSVKSVTVSPAAATIYLDKDTHKQLTATVSVTGGAAQTVNWASNNTSVATVSNTGYVTALAEGSATITATSTFDNSKKGTCTITVKETGGSDPAVNSVTVTPSSYTMVLKDETHKQLTATVDVEGDAPTTVDWLSSNTAVATVNGSGVVTGKSAGTAVITATSKFDNTKKGTCTLTVENQEEDIVIDNEYVAPDVGSHFDLTVTSKDGGDITWTWDDYVEKFLSIPKNVTASGEILTIIVKGNGYAELTATETNGHSVVCYIVAGTGIMDPDEEEETPSKPKQQSNASMPTWSWFAIGGGSAALIAGIVIAIIFIKKRPA